LLLKKEKQTPRAAVKLNGAESVRGRERLGVFRLKGDVRPIHGQHVGDLIQGVDDRQPRLTWKDPADYDRVATRLARDFEQSFAEFAPHVSPEVRAAGPLVR